MSILAFFIIAENWKQPKYPSRAEWKNKMWDIHTMEHDTEVKLNDLLHATAWMNLTSTMMTNMKFKNWQNDHLCAEVR